MIDCSFMGKKNEITMSRCTDINYHTKLCYKFLYGILKTRVVLNDISIIGSVSLLVRLLKIIYNTLRLATHTVLDDIPMFGSAPLNWGL